MEFKGLMESKSFEGSKLRKYHSNVSDFVDDAPPIVLIKPLHNSNLQKELPCKNKCTCRRKASVTEKMLKPQTIEEGVPPEKTDTHQGVLDSIDIHRTVRPEKNLVKRISQEKRTKDFAEAIARPSKESKIQDNRSSTREKVSVPASYKLQKKEVIEKRVEKTQRVAPSIRKAAENNQVIHPNSRIYFVPKANNQGKINCTKVGNPRESSVSKNQVAVTKCVTSSPISKKRAITKLHNSANWKKNVKDDKLADKSCAVVVETKGHKGVDLEINSKFEKRDARNTPLEQLTCEEMRGASDNYAEDDSSIPCESTTLIIPQDCDVTRDQINKSGVSCSLIENESRKIRTSVKEILLSSASFFNQAEKLFAATADQQMEFEETSLNDYEMADGKLILDCANEWLECKRQERPLTVYPLRQHPIKGSKCSMSFDLLVAGICNGIENLESYSKLGDDILLIDTVYAVLRRDLWGKGVISRTWDFGWKIGYTLNEVEQVVFHMEELLITGIIEDLLLEFSS